MYKTENLDKINPIKKKEIGNLLDYVSKNGRHIKKVVIFGSTVRNDCRPDSDIDICLYSDIDRSDIESVMFIGGIHMLLDSMCDVFIYKYIPNGKFKTEIDTKGVTIYENTNN